MKRDAIPMKRDAIPMKRDAIPMKRDAIPMKVRRYPDEKGPHLAGLGRASATLCHSN